MTKTSEQRANEPSMEEILASIRRIIADDRMLPLSSRASPGPAPAGAPDPSDAPFSPEPTLATAPERRRGEASGEREPAAEAPALRVVPGGLPERLDERVFDAFEDDLAAFEKSLQPEAPEEEAPAAQQPPPAPEPLISARTDASVASCFQSLAATMLLQNESVVEQSIRDLLRPMLKQWLDDNLPTIVERLVRAEIERVARGARG